MKNNVSGRLLPAVRHGGFRDDRYMIWCGSVVRGEDGRYHMFASRWESQYGFSMNWLYRSEVVRASADTPEGPFRFEEVVLPVRGRQYFDGMNTHNPYIRFHKGKYYLYYIGVSYGGPVPETPEALMTDRNIEVWNNKRIGVAVSDSVFGPWTRFDKPLLEPRGFDCWDCTITSNPAVAILEDGATYMLYKSRSFAGDTLQIGLARADHPLGPFERVQSEPLFDFQNRDFHVEDPYLWHEDGKFRLLIKDDYKNNCGGISGHWGAGVYAESDDCLHWTFDKTPVYTRRVQWDDGTQTEQSNVERPFLLLENGRPTHLYLATGDGGSPYNFKGNTYNMVIPLQK